MVVREAGPAEQEEAVVVAGEEDEGGVEGELEEDWSQEAVAAGVEEVGEERMEGEKV